MMETVQQQIFLSVKLTMVMKIATIFIQQLMAEWFLNVP